MSDPAFKRAMGQIAQEAEQLQRDELRAERRRELFRKVRRVGSFIIGAALLGYAFVHRQELEQQFQKLIGKPATQSDANTTGNLKNIQDAANKRDAALEDLTKK